MTITEFLDKVPWDKMHIERDGEIRQTKRVDGTRLQLCPLQAVFGVDGYTHRAKDSGLDPYQIMDAADNAIDMRFNPRLRRRMVARINASRRRS